MRSPHFLRAVRERARQVVGMPGARVAPWIVLAVLGALLVAGVFHVQNYGDGFISRGYI